MIELVLRRVGDAALQFVLERGGVELTNAPLDQFVYNLRRCGASDETIRRELDRAFEKFAEVLRDALAC